jgi:hypothetical protein
MHAWAMPVTAIYCSTVTEIAVLHTPLTAKTVNQPLLCCPPSTKHKQIPMHQTRTNTCIRGTPPTNTHLHKAGVPLAHPQHTPAQALLQDCIRQPAAPAVPGGVAGSQQRQQQAQVGCAFLGATCRAVCKQVQLVRHSRPQGPVLTHCQQQAVDLHSTSRHSTSQHVRWANLTAQGSVDAALYCQTVGLSTGM